MTGDSNAPEEEGSAEEDSSGYVHQPVTDAGIGSSNHGVLHPDATEREFDWRGWLLVGVLCLAFVVAPAVIYLVPPTTSVYLTVLIVFPLFPALLLAAVAVWATTRP